MKKYIAVFLTMIMVIGLVACGEEAKPKGITNTAEYENCILTLGDAVVVTTEDGEKTVKIEATYTNNGNEPMYAYCSFAVRAFQNDVQIDEISDINGDEASLIKEIKNGESISVAYVFKMEDDSQVEVLIGEPTADQTTIGRQEYLRE